MMNYPKFDLRREEDNSRPTAAVHAVWFEEVFTPHMKLLSENTGGHSRAITDSFKWLRSAAQHLGKRVKEAQDSPLEVSCSHERFRNRLARYPPRGRYDGAIMLNDGHFFNDLVKAIEKTGGCENPWEAAEQKLNSFQCSVTTAQKGEQEAILSTPGLAVEAEKQREFLIPFLVIEHKRKDTNENQRPTERAGKNQRLFYSVSAARFLFEMGIIHYPVFGLTTAGPLASFCIVWYSIVEVSSHIFTR